MLVLGIILITDCDLRQANHKADAPVLLVCDWVGLLRGAFRFECVDLSMVFTIL